MKTGDLVKLFGVSSQTIKRWTVEFSEFLSDSARGVNSRQSVFESDDFIVMATISNLSAQGMSLADIKSKLADGYRVDDVSAATVGYMDGRMVPAAVVDQVVDSAQIAIELAQVKAERDKLLTMLEDAQTRIERIQSKSEEREEALRTELKTLSNQIADLQHRLGLAEGELKLRQEQAQKKRWWG